MNPFRLQPSLLAAGLISAASLVFAQAPNTGPLVFGISNSAEWGAENKTLWPYLSEAGATMIKEFPEWGWVEPAKGQMNWKPADHTIALAKQNNVGLYGLLCYLAPWASQNGKDTRLFPMKDYRDFGTYAGASIDRYKDQITYWEVWNEFNSTSFSKNSTPKHYAEILTEAYRQGKKANPNVKIGMGSADVGYSFFEQVIKEGGAGHFDFIAVHPYSMMEAVSSGREEAMLSMSGNLRALLKKTGQPVDMEIVVSEMGLTVSNTPQDEHRQAVGLVKGHALCYAQGINQIYWFEGRGPDYGKGKTFGLLRKDWSKRPSYFAYKTMTTLFGRNARRIGWFNPTNKSYGFMFEGASGPVLIMWADGESDTVTFPGAVIVTDIEGNPSSQVDGKVALTDDPVFITGLDETTVAQARANAAKPFPWLKDLRAVDSVSVVMGATNVENGLLQLEQGDGKTTTSLIDGIYPRRPNRNPYIYFDVDDSYAAVGDRQVEITVIAQPVDPAKGATFGLTYESSKGYKTVKDNKKLPKTPGWQTYTYKIDDANFGGSWGWNFRLEHAQGVWVKEVIVKRIGAKS